MVHFSFRPSRTTSYRTLALSDFCVPARVLGSTLLWCIPLAGHPVPRVYVEFVGVISVPIVA